MTATLAIAISYSLGLAVLGIDALLAQRLRGAALARVLEETPDP